MFAFVFVILYLHLYLYCILYLYLYLLGDYLCGSSHFGLEPKCFAFVSLYLLGGHLVGSTHELAMSLCPTEWRVPSRLRQVSLPPPPTGHGSHRGQGWI